MNAKLFERINVPENFSLDFWRSEPQIINYCKGILAHNNITKVNLALQFSSDRAEVYSSEKYNAHTITLPDVSLVNDEKLKIKNIVARTVFLRHELAHILFTKGSYKALNRTIYNYFDDIRIENLFCKIYKGNYKLFADVIKMLFDKPDVKRSLLTPSKISFCIYARMRQKGYKITLPTEITNFYDRYYDKYKYLFYIEDFNKFIEGVDSFINEFDSDKKITSELYETIKQQIIKKQQEKEEEVLPEESNSEEESKDEEFIDINIDQVDSSEEADEEDNNSNIIIEAIQEDEEESSESTDEIKEIFNNETPEEEKENKEIEDLLSEDEILKLNPFDYSDLLKEVTTEKEIFDLDEYNFNPDDFSSATTINFYRLAPLVKGFIRKDGHLVYKTIVNKHRKVINETINYLKLKLKLRNKEKHLFGQYDGRLDQRGLKDLFVSDNPQVFYNTIKQIQNSSDFFMLIDFSGSMDLLQRRESLYSAIVLMEVCKALNINYDINVFANGAFKFKIDNNPETEKRARDILSRDLINNVNAYPRKYFSLMYILGGARDYLIKLKSINEKHSAFYEILIGSMLASLSNLELISGSTPEIQSFLTLIKDNLKRKNSKKNIFIINDGGYNNLRFKMGTPINYQASSEYLFIDKLFLEKNGIDIVIKKSSEVLLRVLKNTHHEKDSALFSVHKYEQLLNHTFFKEPLELKQRFKECLFQYNENEYRINLYNLLDFERSDLNIFYVYFNAYKQNDSLTIYKKCIKFAEENNFQVYGFGIRSNHGKTYLGDKFEVFKDASDIEENLASKIRKIF